MCGFEVFFKRNSTLFIVVFATYSANTIGEHTTPPTRPQLLQNIKYSVAKREDFKTHRLCIASFQPFLCGGNRWENGWEMVAHQRHGRSFPRSAEADQIDPLRLEDDLQVYLARNPCVLDKAYDYAAAHPRLVYSGVLSIMAAGALITRLLVVHMSPDTLLAWPVYVLLVLDIICYVSCCRSSSVACAPSSSSNAENVVRKSALPLSAVDLAVVEAGESSALYCHRCVKARPARSHHCPTCDACIYKRDHHCPWIANCVGEHNQRDFLLFTGYACVLSTAAILWTMKYYFFVSFSFRRR